MLHALLLMAVAQTVPPRSFVQLPSSNGHGAILVDTNRGAVTHFREHLPATEEPLLDATKAEVWVGNQPQMIKTRDVLFDTYFGVRAGGQQRWLNGQSISNSRYDGASGIVTFTQSFNGVTLKTFAFAPKSFPHAGYALITCASSATVQQDVKVYLLDNFHLGFGRPGVMADLEMNGETVAIATNHDVFERGFAGVVGLRPLGTSTATAWNSSSPSADNAFLTVRDTPNGITARTGEQATADDSVSALQFELGTLQPNVEQCVGVVAAHHGDPFAQGTVSGWFDAWVQGRSAHQVLADERAGWNALALTLPDAGEPELERQAGIFLAMGQVQTDEAWLRESLSRDGEARFTRFKTLDGGSTLPNTIRHRGKGAVLASLPPGEWTYSWVRDGAYATVAMAELGMVEQSSAGLEFFLDAEGGRFKSWDELKPAGFPPYVISLTRYVGFGVEETDFNDFGPNLEFDGFGLVLWALREHEMRTGDVTLVDRRWSDISTRVADPLVAIIDPQSGLLRKDSSIWETHWNGRERTWTYSNLTAARGLCDVAELAARKSDMARATSYRLAANTLRTNIARRLTDRNGALASNAEELLVGEGYFDAAVFEAIAMGLFDPHGRIATATLDALESKLKVNYGPGWSRNDDRVDHGDVQDLSPWGSEYDSAEWVVTDMRGVIALREAGRTARADEVLAFTTAQAKANANAFVETYEESTGVWKFNAPMLGFGAGAWVLSLAHASGRAIEPACGAYFDENLLVVPDAGVPDAGPVVTIDAGVTPTDAGVTAPPTPPNGCGCDAAPMAVVAALMTLILRRRSRS